MMNTDVNEKGTFMCVLGSLLIVGFNFAYPSIVEWAQATSAGRAVSIIIGPPSRNGNLAESQVLQEEIQMTHKDDSVNVELEPLHIFTFLTEFKISSCIMATTIHHYGGKLNILGLGYECEDEKCRAHEQQNAAFPALRGALEKRSEFGIEENDLILMVDGFDVLFQRNVSGIVKTYHEFELRYNTTSPIIFEGEPNCFPYGEGLVTRVGAGVSTADREFNSAYGVVLGKHICDLMYNVTDGEKHEHPFLNSGGFIGHASDVLNLLQKFDQLKNDDPDFFVVGDQPVFMGALVRYPELNIRLDGNSRIFLSLLWFESEKSLSRSELCGDDYFVDDTPPNYIVSGDVPFLIHFNGGEPKERFLERCELCFGRHVRHEIEDATFFDVLDMKEVNVANVCEEELKLFNWHDHDRKYS